MVHGHYIDEVKQKLLIRLYMTCRKMITDKPELGVADQYLLNIIIDDKRDLFAPLVTTNKGNNKTKEFCTLQA